MPTTKDKTVTVLCIKQNNPWDVQQLPTPPAPPAGPSSKVHYAHRQSLVMPEAPNILTKKNKKHTCGNAQYCGWCAALSQNKGNIITYCVAKAQCGSSIISHETGEAVLYLLSTPGWAEENPGQAICNPSSFIWAHVTIY